MVNVNHKILGKKGSGRKKNSLDIVSETMLLETRVKGEQKSETSEIFNCL